MALTAATGIAATHIQGTTLHAAMGCGAASTYKDFGMMMKKENRARIRGWDVSCPPTLCPLCRACFWDETRRTGGGVVC